MCTVTAPRFRAPLIEDTTTGRLRRPKMERCVVGPFVDFAYLHTANARISEQRETIRKLEAEVQRLKDAMETRELLEVALKADIQRRIQETLTNKLKSIAK